MRAGASTVCLLAVAGLITACPAELRADGGTLRASEQSGPFRITAFTSPTPPRPGPIDVSVMVQDAATDKVLPEAEVTISATGQGGGHEIRGRASAAAATNKLLQAALIRLPSAGRWTIDARVISPAGSGEMAFQLDVAPPLARWLELLPWFAWPLGVVALFVASEWARRGRR
jgi:hypothetical protein